MTILMHRRSLEQSVTPRLKDRVRNRIGGLNRAHDDFERTLYLAKVMANVR